MISVCDRNCQDVCQDEERRNHRRMLNICILRFLFVARLTELGMDFQNVCFSESGDVNL